MKNVHFILVDYDEESRLHTKAAAESSGHEIVREVAEPIDLPGSIDDMRTGRLDATMLLCSKDSVNEEFARTILALGVYVVRYDGPTTNQKKLESPTRRDISQLMIEVEEHPDIRQSSRAK